MAEQLFRVCPECKGRGYIETDQRIEISPENEFAIRASCVACSDNGYVPVDAPEPLTGEEIKAIVQRVANTAGVLSFIFPTRRDANEQWWLSIMSHIVRTSFAALPARFGVRMEGTTDET